MSFPAITAIVEGRGDEKAIPALLRRVLREHMDRHDIEVQKAKFTNGKRGLVNRFSDFLHYAVRDGCKAILVVFDADEDCPLELATDLYDKVIEARLSVPVAIVCAKSEFETWLICSLSGAKGQRLREKLHIPEPVCIPENIEEIRDAKGWLQQRMERGDSYKPAIEQVDLTYHIAFDLVLPKSRSFRRFYHAVEELVGAIDKGKATVTPAHLIDICSLD